MSLSILEATLTPLVSLASELDGKLYAASVVGAEGAIFALLRLPESKRLAIFAPPDHPARAPFEGAAGRVTVVEEAHPYLLCPLTAANAAALRERFGWLRPRLLGLQPSVGTGDRLGLATPAHAQAVARAGNMMPIFAQQSIRENSRTRRTPQEVIDDATWGVFEAGWREGYGADADHLKNTDDIDVTTAAGYTFFTIDPGEHVAGEADTLDEQALAARLDALPWAVLNDSAEAMRTRYGSEALTVGETTIPLDERSLAVAAVKYGRAAAHTAAMYRYLVEKVGADGFELEVSVDETDSPTSLLEHFYIASELKRLGVEWVSLAPRFVGRFEKGVDYQGEAGGLTDTDLARFREDFAGHAAIAREVGPYKLSLHSGSDKFSIYPIAAELTGGLVHLKTAGTSYLEALRTIAQVNPVLFREIYAFARDRYPTDRATYHVSADAARMPDASEVSDAALPDLLDHFDARQALHVTFGSVLNETNEDGSYRFKDALFQTLRTHEAEHYAIVERHFDRHLSPFKTEAEF